MTGNVAETARVETAVKEAVLSTNATHGLDRKVSVAPMMDWTDRHCRYFLRGFSPRTLLYTEMITAAAIEHGDRDRLLRFSPEEHPVALQLGGSDPAQLALAARAGEEHGYDEINLNCGCPSDRVRSGAFGACLMLQPRLVADCVAAMQRAVKIPVTVKLRIGVIDSSEGTSWRDTVQRFDDDDYARLLHFAGLIVEAGAEALIVHARKAVLGGLSPKDNRDVPPLRYDVPVRLKQDMPDVPIVVNGGLRTVEQVSELTAGCDGAMLGREAYHRPYFLAELHAATWPDDAWRAPTPAEQLDRMLDYARRELAAGERLANITRHMLGLLSHQPGVREFRRLLSEGARDAAAGITPLLRARELLDAA